MSKKIIFFILIILLIGVAAFYLYKKIDNQFKDGHLRWISINVTTPNQGDAHLIIKNNQAILIDGGTYNMGTSKLIPFLKNHNILTLDEIMITHPHIDHYGGIKAILEDKHITVKKLSMNMPTREQMDREYWGGKYQDLLDIRSLAEEKGVPIAEIKQGDRFNFDDESFMEVLYVYDGINTPVGKTDINDMSVISMVYDNNNKFLLTGDLNNKLGTYLAKNAKNIKADVLKVPHHAAEGLAPNSFFDKVGAKDFVITAPSAYWNENWDRSKRVRDYVKEHDISAYVNGINGNIIVISNSDGYDIQCIEK